MRACVCVCIRKEWVEADGQPTHDRKITHNTIWFLTYCFTTGFLPFHYFEFVCLRTINDRRSHMSSYTHSRNLCTLEGKQRKRLVCVSEWVCANETPKKKNEVIKYWKIASALFWLNLNWKSTQAVAYAKDIHVHCVNTINVNRRKCVVLRWIKQIVRIQNLQPNMGWVGIRFPPSYFDLRDLLCANISLFYQKVFEFIEERDNPLGIWSIVIFLFIEYFFPWI